MNLKCNLVIGFYPSLIGLRCWKSGCNLLPTNVKYKLFARVSILQHFTPVSALLGGALIGLSAVLLLWLIGRVAGISSIMSGLFTTAGSHRHWRIAFLLGLMSGAALWNLMAADGLAFRQDYPPALIVVGGLLVGIGTRLGSGCTSGHGICGIAMFSKRSIAATLAFMSTGFLTVYVIRHVLQGVS